MASTIPQPPGEIANAIEMELGSRHRLWLVGGAVRDHFLQRMTTDFDFAFDGDARQLARRLADRLSADYYSLDDSRDTGRVLSRDSVSWTTLDFAGLRGETIEADLASRDFTINALAVEFGVNKLVDPLGGLQHLRDRIVALTGPQSLERDPIRIMRAIRLAAELDLTLSPGLPQRLRQAAPSLTSVTGERRRDELFRLLTLTNPSGSLRALGHLGALEPALGAQTAVNEGGISTVDRLSRLIDVLGPSHDPDGAGDLSLAHVALNLGRYRVQLSDHLNQSLSGGRRRRSILLLAAILSGWNEAMPKLAPAVASNLRLSRVESDVVSLLSAGIGASGAQGALEDDSLRAVFSYFRRYGAIGVDLILVGLARVLSQFSGPPDESTWLRALQLARAYVEVYYDRPDVIHPTALLRGDEVADLLGIAPGPIVGQVLDAMLLAQAVGELDDREAAIRFVKKWTQTRTG